MSMDIEKLVFEIIKENLVCQKKTNISDYIIEEVEEEKIEKSKIDIIKRLEAKGINGKCSDFLLNQLTLASLGYYALYKDRMELFHMPSILNLIEVVDKCEKMGNDFHGEVLKGFSKIHIPRFNSAYSEVFNVQKYWFKSGSLRKERQEAFYKIVEECKGDLRAICISLGQKCRLHTGEWLIYKKIENRCYYLCLAGHEEGDQVIYDEKISKCFDDFPEVISFIRE